MLKYLKLKVPTIRHSNLSIVRKNLFLKKTNFYYLNANGNYKKNLIEFTNLKYSKIVQDKNLFKHKNKNLFKKRSDILANEVLKRFKKKIKILDYGCNQGDLLIKLKRLGYKNLFGHDINFYFSKYLKKKKD